MMGDALLCMYVCMYRCKVAKQQGRRRRRGNAETEDNYEKTSINEQMMAIV